jgi:hypothetical protein
MKNSFLIALLSCLCLAACSKSAEELTNSEAATVYSVKYPCGSACTAQGWVLETASGTIYEPANLPTSFASHELPVTVAFRKTGKRSALYAGTGEELIIIQQIQKR